MHIPFTPTATARKGIVRNPSEHLHIDAVTRETLLQAMARAVRWSDEIRSGKVTSLNEIAITEQIGEGHVRRLLPLAFLVPTIVEAITNGTAPAGLTVSRMAEALPHAGQSKRRCSDSPKPELREPESRLPSPGRTDSPANAN
jgi:hypothetical protein